MRQVVNGVESILTRTHCDEDASHIGRFVRIVAVQAAPSGDEI